MKRDLHSGTSVAVAIAAATLAAAKTVAGHGARGYELAVLAAVELAQERGLA